MLQKKKLDSKHSIRSGSITKNKTQEFSFRDQKKEKQLNFVNENCSDDQFNNITNANLQFKFEKLKKSKQSTKFNAIQKDSENQKQNRFKDVSPFFRPIKTPNSLGDKSSLKNSNLSTKFNTF